MRASATAERTKPLLSDDAMDSPDHSSMQQTAAKTLSGLTVFHNFRSSTGGMKPAQRKKVLPFDLTLTASSVEMGRFGKLPLDDIVTVRFVFCRASTSQIDSNQTVQHEATLRIVIVTASRVAAKTRTLGRRIFLSV